jgi:hypothetical protein
MIALPIGDADFKPARVTRATAVSQDHTTVTQIFGHSGRFILPAILLEFRQSVAAAKQLGKDLAELILDAIRVTMDHCRNRRAHAS